MQSKWLSNLRAKIKGTGDESSSPEYYIGLGMCFGVAFGTMFDNIGLGISLGLLIGVAVQKIKDKKA